MRILKPGFPGFFSSMLSRTKQGDAFGPGSCPSGLANCPGWPPLRSGRVSRSRSYGVTLGARQSCSGRVSRPNRAGAALNPARPGLRVAQSHSGPRSRIRSFGVVLGAVQSLHSSQPGQLSKSLRD